MRVVRWQNSWSWPQVCVVVRSVWMEMTSPAMRVAHRVAAQADAIIKSLNRREGGACTRRLAFRAI